MTTTPLPPVPPPPQVPPPPPSPVGEGAPAAPDGERLRRRLAALAEIGAIDGGGTCRMALTEEDGAGRDLVVAWMRELGLRIDIDAIGNVVGTWPAHRTDPPVMMGSHIDTVRTGGRYDSGLGVVAGLEVIETFISSGEVPLHPLAVAVFTDEEGVRFAPDMLGSLVYAGGLPLEDALDVTDRDGVRLGDELERIGYRGIVPCPGPAPHAYVALHIEQGPVLETEDVVIGAVTGVQGISWNELTITGQANHTGTTPMHLRRDAAYAAAKITTFVRDLGWSLGHHQMATVGRMDLFPDLVNVVPERAVMTVDLRNTDETTLLESERRLSAYCADIARKEGVTITSRSLARFGPVSFHAGMIELVEQAATAHHQTVMRLPSGAGQDAQMLARVCPTGMVFVPSAKGISHNPAEYTSDEHVDAGVAVLFEVVARLARNEAVDEAVAAAYDEPEQPGSASLITGLTGLTGLTA